MRLTTNRAPEYVCKKALSVLKQFQDGKLRPKHYWQSKHVGLNVSPKWRLLSRDNCQTWELMSHSKYNTEVDKK